jgi:hypothetical protein
MAATQAEVDRVLAAYENAKAAQEYAESIVMEMQQISGTDYKMVWSNQYPTD